MENTQHSAQLWCGMNPQSLYFLSRAKIGREHGHRKSGKERWKVELFQLVEPGLRRNYTNASQGERDLVVVSLLSEDLPQRLWGGDCAVFLHMFNLGLKTENERYSNLAKKKLADEREEENEDVWSACSVTMCLALQLPYFTYILQRIDRCWEKSYTKE